MHTIIKSENSLWTVGYQVGNEWRPLQDFAWFSEAAAICSWLNGGLEPSLADKLVEAFKIGGAFR